MSEKNDKPVAEASEQMIPDPSLLNRQRGERKVARVVIIILGVILTPVAMFICGFCCCWVGIMGQNEYVMVIGLCFGWIAGAVLSIMAFRSMWKKVS